MTPYLLVAGLFLGWTLIGIALLALVRADTGELRVVLVAPVLGSCITLIAVFPFSEAGMPVARCAPAVTIVLLLVAVAIVALRRPAVHPGAAAVGVLCLGGGLLTAWPMFSLGFGWLGNGNDDMSNFVLSAQDLLRHGLLAPVDFNSLMQGRDYSSVLTGMHISGSRPGTDMLLAIVSRVAGRPPYETYMPVIVAFNLCTASAVGALAMQAARRWWACVLATGLLLVSPLATYGVLQQLLAQVWGLGVLAALFALLMRAELHEGKGARARDVIPIAILAGGLVLGYVELLPEFGLAYLTYVVTLGFTRRRLSRSALIRLWVPAVAIIVVYLNGYLFTELGDLRDQITHGVASSFPPLFGYIFVPSGLPGIFGLQVLPPGAEAPLLNASIVLAALLLVAVIVGSLLSARRGVAAAFVLLAEALFGLILILERSDFGLFKLVMYIQPFVAAAVAIWVSRLRNVWGLGLVAVLLGALTAAQLSTQHVYVDASRDPGNVPHLSATDVIPAFHSFATSGSGPVVSVTENPVLIKLEAAAAVGHQVFFQSRDVFGHFVSEYDGKVSGKQRVRGERAISKLSVSRSFKLLNSAHAADAFQENPSAIQSLLAPSCKLVFSGPHEVPFNRYALPPSAPDLLKLPCRSPRDLLAFTSSTLGESFYLPVTRKSVSFFQPQSDPFFSGRNMTGFGRYAMFQVLGYQPGTRLVVELTDTLNHDGANLLPPSAVVGSTRQRLPLGGRGSARVFSAPVTPQLIAGVPYVLIDMGVNGRLPTASRHGLQDVYGGSVPIDPDYLTAFVRDVSLVTPTQYAKLKPPASISAFPRDLQNPNLEYTGLYEDGWMGRDANVRLASGPAAELVVSGEVPAGAGGHLQLLVDGRQVVSQAIVPGRLDVRADVPRSTSSRLVALRFAKAIKLHAPDLRPAAAQLSFLGLISRRGSAR